MHSRALLCVAALGLAAVGCAASTASETEAPQAESSEALTRFSGLAWRNILNVSYQGQLVNTTFAPNVALRPFRGQMLRISIPASCAGGQISVLQLFGATLVGNQRLPLGANVVATDVNRFTGASEFYYQVNGGLGATIREVGIQGFFPTGLCTVAYEQANNLVTPPPRASCQSQGGFCASSPIDVTFPADCAQDFNLTTGDGACPAINQACCIQAVLPPPPATCGSKGGLCLSSPIDVTFGADCEQDFNLRTTPGTCAAINQTCCVSP